MFKHRKSLAVLAIVAAMACVAGGALNADRPQQGTTMHVQQIEIGFYGGPFRGRDWLAAAVTVVDQNNQAVSNATVSGTFTHCDGRVYDVSGKTNRVGLAVIKVKSASQDDCGCACGCYHEFTVNSVAKRASSYDPSANTVTSVSDCIDCFCL